MRLLVLYSELAGYFYSCLIELVENYDVDVEIIMWPKSIQAPFNFKEHNRIKIYNKNEFRSHRQLKNHCNSFNPDVIYVSGWMDNSYLKLSIEFKSKGKIVIVAFDTQWLGTLKQKLATIFFPLLIRTAFTYAWIPGFFQYEYARRLGFNRKNILLGMYSGDQKVFHNAFIINKANKSVSFPKTFAFVGRFSPEKGAVEFYNTFNSLTNDERNGWKLIFIGAGPQKEQLIPNENIIVKDFMQAKELVEFIPNLGCLVFPSLRDAWGVSVHEFCAAGLPLIVSDAAGSINAFVKVGYNGFTFESGNYEDLKNRLITITKMSDIQLNIFGERSARLSYQITTEIWASSLISLSTNYNSINN